MVDGAAADEWNGDLVGRGAEMGGIEGNQRWSHPEIKQQRAGQHGETNAQAHDHPGAKQEHARLEAEADELPAVDGGIAGGRHQVGQMQFRLEKEPVENAERPLAGVKDADDQPGGQSSDQHVSLPNGLGALAVQALQGDRGRHPGGKGQFLLVDHLPFHGHGQKDAERGGEDREADDDPHRLVITLEEE